MLTRTVRAAVVVMAGIGAAAAAITPAQAAPVPPMPCPVAPAVSSISSLLVDDCGEPIPDPPPPGGGGTPPAPAYTLSGVIQLEDTGHDGTWPYRRGGIKVRGYSRLANSSNDRVDANYINVRCTATVPLGYQTTDYDSENNGALVDVHFWSPVIPVTGVPAAIRTVTVTCSHHAEKYGVSYDTTSTAQYVIPE